MHITKTKKQQAGLSLIEMMVALTIGMIVISAGLLVFSRTLSTNSSQMKYSQLNNDLRAAMTFITRDLRRTGYHNWDKDASAPYSTNNFSANVQTTRTLPAQNTTSDNLEVSYDIQATAATSIYGFRLTNRTIQARVGTTGAWSNVTDPDVIEITTFSITNLSPNIINLGTGTTPVTVPVYRVQMTGRLLRDPSAVRTIEETVRLRNVILGS